MSNRHNSSESARISKSMKRMSLNANSVVEEFSRFSTYMRDIAKMIETSVSGRSQIEIPHEYQTDDYIQGIKKHLELIATDEDMFMMIRKFDDGLWSIDLYLDR